MKVKTDLKYPYEYIAAQIEFGSKIVALTKTDPRKVFNNYTCLYGTLSNYRYSDDGENFWIKEVLKKFNGYLLKYKSPRILAKKVYELYLTIPLDTYKIEPPSKLHFGCFRLNNSSYYTERKQVRLHFVPSRKAPDLASVYLADRVAEFSALINYIHQNRHEFGGATHFVSSSWLQNIPTYRSLFPETEDGMITKVENGYWWIWGQFLKWDMSGNVDRFEAFRKDLKKARTLDDVIDAIPLQIYEVKVPLEKMFEKYVPNYGKKRGIDIQAATKFLIQLGSRPTFLGLFQRNGK